MTKRTMIAALLVSVSAVAFEPNNGWKKDADGKLEVDGNGNPIYIDTAGKELAVEGTTISRLNGEAKTNRERAEAAETKVKAYGDLDPEAAKKALDTVSKLDQKALIDAGEVDKVKGEITKQYETQIAERDKTINGLTGDRDNLIRKNAFMGSEFIRDRVAVPPEMFEATFGGQFKVEDGKLVPYAKDGNKIWSKKTMGEIASVDEAFELMVENYPHKDQILKAPEQQGSGGGGGGGNRGGSRTIRRGEFNAMDPMKQSQVAEQMNKGEVQLVD